MNPLVSIIVPCYNQAKYLNETLESIINQTHQNWECIIINDGSQDDTEEVAKSWVSKDDRFKYFFQENTGVSRARNQGIKFSKGELIAFLDSDDLWLRNKLEMSLLHFDVKYFDLIFTESYSTTNFNVSLESINYNKMGVIDDEYFGNSGLQKFIKSNRIPTLTVILKKDKIQQIGCFDESFSTAEDYDLWLRLLKKGSKFKSISLPLSVYRIQNQSSTSHDRLATNSVILCLIKNFTFDEIQKLNQMQNVRNWIYKWILVNFTKRRINDLTFFLKYYNLLTYKLQTILFFKFLFTTVALKRILLKRI